MTMLLLTYIPILERFRSCTWNLIFTLFLEGLIFGGHFVLVFQYKTLELIVIKDVLARGEITHCLNACLPLAYHNNLRQCESFDSKNNVILFHSQLDFVLSWAQRFRFEQQSDYCLANLACGTFSEALC